jgi:SAM-dependent methyltransferase
METNLARAFNDAKHGAGDWDTKVLAYRSGMLRAAAGYVSAKRRGVDRLAKMAPNARLVLDAGAGSGAYSVWFLLRTPCTVVSLDVSLTALRQITGTHAKAKAGGRVLPVCADLAALPFKQEVFDAVFSVDTLGHVASVSSVLDEFLRTCRPGSPLFLHSECSDYRNRWPDRMLMKKLGKDMPAEMDGHTRLLPSADLFMAYSRRFRVVWFDNPAGYFGWFMGYPEKYLPAFRQAGLADFVRVLWLCAAIKRAPVLGGLLRLTNAMTNHAETFFGFSGGGSCFALLKKP